MSDMSAGKVTISAENVPKEFLGVFEDLLLIERNKRELHVDVLSNVYAGRLGFSPNIDGVTQMGLEAELSRLA